jgi:hypothetical protein
MEGNFGSLVAKQDFVARCQNHLCCHYNFPEDWGVDVASFEGSYGTFITISCFVDDSRRQM